MLLAGLAWFGPAQGVAQTNSPGEYEVKAAFVYNFIRFVEWPAESFAGPESPYVVCVVGEDPFGPVLERVLADRVVMNRRVESRRVSSTAAVGSSCHVAFVGEGNADAVLRGPHGVLTVGEGRQFTLSGGMIELHLEEQKVRFSVNVAPANAAGLRISSQLLKLAEVVLDSASKGNSGHDVQ